jgi:alkylation response protein AidB-like acyl-CoA dehydrogenase
MSRPDFSSFVHAFQRGLREIILEHPVLETDNRLEGLPRELLNKLLAPAPFSVFIPTEYGGWGDKPEQCLNLLEATAYESIAVALMIGINGSLFLEPVAKYGHPAARNHVFDSFLNRQTLGGLMITEPEFGTDALAMQTSYSESTHGFKLQGTKHWGGLTGLADFWLITARKTKENGSLARDIDLFICDQNQPGQRIEVKEYYQKLGLFLIPYGLNKIQITIPATARLVPHSSGIKLMMDLLHRSRLRLSGIGLGFIKRMLDEALQHCRQRFVGGKSLLEYDQVQHRLSQLQAWFTVNSAMCHYAARVSDVKNDLTSFGLQANSTKAVLTDMMQDAAQSLLQLVGAKGYRRDHIAGRAVADSRPFQIFEGSNDVMYSQIADAVLKEMKKQQESDLFEFLRRFQPTANITEYYKELLRFKIDFDPLQRVRVVLGKLVARLITTGFVLELLEAGFRKDLVNNAIQVVGNTIAELVANLPGRQSINVIEDYLEQGDWKFLVPN